VSLKDYAQRKYDYLALQNVQLKGDNQLGMELFNADTSGKICTGVQKLAQRWLLEFLTETGSMPGLPTRGCIFMRLARTGGFRTRRNVGAVFAAAGMVINRNLRQEETDDMPADERFGTATLVSAAVMPGDIEMFDQSSFRASTSAVYLNITVKIISAAGTDYTIIFPVETLP
jgi:hypothetical protein